MSTIPLCLAGETVETDKRWGWQSGSARMGKVGRGALKTPTESLQKGETPKVTELTPWSQPYRP